MTENFAPSLKLRKVTFMYRFTRLLVGVALLCVPGYPARKPKPPVIEVCYGGVCLVGLHWERPDSFGNSTSISGALVNKSVNTLGGVLIEFSLLSAETLADTTFASFSGEIPPGGVWQFSAPFSDWNGRLIITKIESGIMRGYLKTLQGSRPFEQSIRFDPVFSPYSRRERKEWEAIHGRRDQ